MSNLGKPQIDKLRMLKHQTHSLIVCRLHREDTVSLWEQIYLPLFEATGKLDWEFFKK